MLTYRWFRQFMLVNRLLTFFWIFWLSRLTITANTTKCLCFHVRTFQCPGICMGQATVDSLHLSVHHRHPHPLHHRYPHIRLSPSTSTSHYRLPPPLTVICDHVRTYLQSFGHTCCLPPSVLVRSSLDWARLACCLVFYLLYFVFNSIFFSSSIVPFLCCWQPRSTLPSCILAVVGHGPPVVKSQFCRTSAVRANGVSLSGMSSAIDVIINGFVSLELQTLFVRTPQRAAPTSATVVTFNSFTVHTQGYSSTTPIHTAPWHCYYDRPGRKSQAK